MKLEQLVSKELFSVYILDKDELFSLGTTTISSLMESNHIKKAPINRHLLRKKLDFLILDSHKNIIIYCKNSYPNKFKNDKDISNAIQKEIKKAKSINALIYVLSDGKKFIWVNPNTGNPILDENNNIVNLKINPKENAKGIAQLINNITQSISEENDVILKKECLDPTNLAVKINKILVNLTFASLKKSLYTFVELFLFKYLSDIGILKGKNSFTYISKMYTDEYKKDNPTTTDADILGTYIDGARENMKALFPKGKDGTSIINGQIFHVERGIFNEYISIDDTDKIFKQIIKEFECYEKKNGKFLKISNEFKSKLFETFMKSSNESSNMGQFFTPLKIVNEMVSMVDIKEGMKICDPACGVGTFLLNSVETKISDFYSYHNGEIKKKIELYGFDKMMSDKDELTIILAKANMLIYFSKLFQDNNSFQDIKNIANSLLNQTFNLNKTMLGTLSNIEENKYDLILANPPYFQSKPMMDLAKETGKYTLNGRGVESLFLEWIMRSLKNNGVASVILPDGIFSNYTNHKIKTYILNNFFIEAIISLPVGSFFNTLKKHISLQ